MFYSLPFFVYGVCTYVHTCKSLRSVSIVFPCSSTTYLLRHHFTGLLGLTDSATVNGERASAVCLALLFKLVITDMRKHGQYFI